MPPTLPARCSRLPASEIEASVAASIYAAWRSSVLSTVINGSIPGLPAPDDFDSLAALRNLLDNFATNGGVGASKVDFFAVPGIVARCRSARLSSD